MCPQILGLSLLSLSSGRFGSRSPFSHLLRASVRRRFSDFNVSSAIIHLAYLRGVCTATRVCIYLAVALYRTHLRAQRNQGGRFLRICGLLPNRSRPLFSCRTRVLSSPGTSRRISVVSQFSRSFVEGVVAHKVIHVGPPRCFFSVPVQLASRDCFRHSLLTRLPGLVFASL